MPVKTYSEIVVLVDANNKSKNVDKETIICLIWKETGFDDSAKNKSSSATGLMQMTKDAVKDVNANTPKGVHFVHSDMTDAAKNIECGTYYLDLRIKRAGGDIKKGMNGFGTGGHYADNIIACGECIKKSIANFTNTPIQNQVDCLIKIHP